MQDREFGVRNRRRRVQRATLAGAVPLAITIVCTGVAVAAPTEQPGVSVPEESQPGVVTAEADQPGVAPAEEPAPVPEPEPAPRQYWVAPPTEYQQIEYQPYQAPSTYDVPGYEQPAGYGEPVYEEPQVLHLPTAVETVAPIQAPKSMLRAGDFMVDQQTVRLSDDDLERTNNQFAIAESQVATFWKSVGFEPERAQKVAAATTAGAASGALAGGTALGAPAAVVGAVPGALIGGTIGGLSGGAIGGVVLPGVGWVPGGTVGTVAGAGIGAAAGAAVLGIPAAVVGGTAGGLVGGAAGTAFGAGDVDGEPLVDLTPTSTPEPAAPAPVVIDTDAVTEQTRAVVAKVEAGPGGPEVVDGVRVVADAAPRVAQDVAGAVTGRVDVVRTVAISQPGGLERVTSLESAVVNSPVGPVGGQVEEVLTAVRAGLA
ncbi:insoluble domain protein [Rhodococcus tukisamuensis]|uniref:Insoluble domain protein n=1 Tax=Rhodococcus tukisamuensis TaxID=168276 RepID=A0A1G7B3T6_9NOCA|nr:insoluble domain protein [Rhodococcus tukisamuensis]SDE20956.1 hypothetical protein SAMN05444580_11233 [Rhodococcus tukisamuensis]